MNGENKPRTDKTDRKDRPVGAFILSLIAGLWMLVAGIVLAAERRGGDQGTAVNDPPAAAKPVRAAEGVTGGAADTPAATPDASTQPATQPGGAVTGGGSAAGTAGGVSGAAGGTSADVGARHGAGYRWVWGQHASAGTSAWEWVGIICGVIVLIGAFVSLASPVSTRGWGVVILIVSIIDLIAGTGGYLAGIVGIIGGILGISWSPGPHLERHEPAPAA